jgi:hypothetical protein
VYNLRTTGIWYLQARFAAGVVSGNESNAQTVWDRLGFNLGWNTLMLAVFFLGIPAVIAVLAGLERRRPITLVLGASALCGLALCLVHDNTGIHSVGPIHLSELVVPLTLLATVGLLRSFAWLGTQRLPVAPAALVVASYLVIACGAFNLSNFASLRMQATSQHTPMAALEELDVHNAIVIAAPYIILVQTNRAFAPWGSWVLDYPQPSPELDDDIVWARPSADPAVLHARFPDRGIYKMTYARDEPAIRVELLHAPK